MASHGKSQSQEHTLVIKPTTKEKPKKLSKVSLLVFLPAFRCCPPAPSPHLPLSTPLCKHKGPTTMQEVWIVATTIAPHRCSHHLALTQPVELPPTRTPTHARGPPRGLAPYCPRPLRKQRVHDPQGSNDGWCSNAHHSTATTTCYRASLLQSPPSASPPT